MTERTIKQPNVRLVGEGNNIPQWNTNINWALCQQNPFLQFLLTRFARWWS